MVRPECYLRSRYDLAQGLLSQETGSGFNGCFFRLTIDDDFRVEGLPDGTQIPLTLRLNAHLGSNGWNGGEGFIGMSSPAGSSSWDQIVHPVPLDPGVD